MINDDRKALARLPHGEEARLLTSAESDPASGRARGVREGRPGDARANGGGFIPSCWLIEMMAQTAGLALPVGSSGAFVAGIRRLHLHGAARASDRVEISAELQRRMGPLFQFRCRAEAAGNLLAHGSIILRTI